jgi:hypothetical protein
VYQGDSRLRGFLLFNPLPPDLLFSGFPLLKPLLSAIFIPLLSSYFQYTLALPAAVAEPFLHFGTHELMYLNNFLLLLLLTRML